MRPIKLEISIDNQPSLPLHDNSWRGSRNRRALGCGRLDVYLSRFLHRATPAVQPRVTWRKPDRLRVVRYVRFIHLAVFHYTRPPAQNCEVSWKPTVMRAVGKAEGL